MTDNYATEAAYKVYIDYLALKQHFTIFNFDYHKYNGKVKANYDSFRTRKDVFSFYKLSKDKNYHNILLSNIVKNPNVWTQDFYDETTYDIYLNWKKRIDGLTYLFTNELSKLKDNFSENFEIKSNSNPYLIDLYLKKQISLETFTILCAVSNTFEYWDNEIKDKIIAKPLIILAKKYYPFLDIDKKKYSKIVKERFF